MIISFEWSTYKDGDVGKAKNMKVTSLDDTWWDKVDYILFFMHFFVGYINLCLYIFNVLDIIVTNG